MKKLPRNIKDKLKQQEHHLTLKDINEAEQDKLIKKIANKLKCETNDVLINKSNVHRAKKELYEIIGRKKLKYESQGNHSW